MVQGAGGGGTSEGRFAPRVAGLLSGARRAGAPRTGNTTGAAPSAGRVASCSRARRRVAGLRAGPRPAARLVGWVAACALRAVLSVGAATSQGRDAVFSAWRACRCLRERSQEGTQVNVGAAPPSGAQGPQAPALRGARTAGLRTGRTVEPAAHVARRRPGRGVPSRGGGRGRGAVALWGRTKPGARRPRSSSLCVVWPLSRTPRALAPPQRCPVTRRPRRPRRRRRPRRAPSPAPRAPPRTSARA